MLVLCNILICVIHDANAKSTCTCILRETLNSVSLYINHIEIFVLFKLYQHLLLIWKLIHLILLLFVHILLQLICCWNNEKAKCWILCIKIQKTHACIDIYSDPSIPELICMNQGLLDFLDANGQFLS